MAELSTVARPYAKAVFEYAHSAGDLAGWEKQLAILAVLAQHDTVKKLLASPSLTSAQHADALIQVAGDEITPAAQNFLRVLSENKRLPLLPAIYEQYEREKAAREQTVDVQITAAYEIDSETEQKLAAALKNKLQRDVNVQTQVDGKLLGGVLVRAGDLVIDGSVRGRLAKLAEAMNA